MAASAPLQMAMCTDATSGTFFSAGAILAWIGDGDQFVYVNRVDPDADGRAAGDGPPYG